VEQLKELAVVVEKTHSTAEEIERAIASLDDLFTQNEAVLDDKTRVEMIDLRAKLVSKKLQVTSVAQDKTEKAKPKRRKVIPINEGEPDVRKRRKKATAFRRNRARTPKTDSSMITVLGAGAILGLLVLLGSGE
jgi:hypothetical protein